MTVLYIEHFSPYSLPHIAKERFHVRYQFAAARKTRVRFPTGFPAMKRFAATAVLVSAALAGAREPGAMIEWPYVGAGQAHTKYSEAGDITAANVGDLFARPK